MSFCHVDMVAKFLDDNKLKVHLKSEFTMFQSSWILSNFISFVKCCRTFLGLNPKGQHLSYEKGKEHFHVVFTKSLKRAREISTFHVAVVQRNVQKGVMSCCCCCFFANINLLLFAIFVAVAVIVA